MPLYIKSDEVAKLVERFATMKGVSKQEAVKIDVQAALDRLKVSIPLREKFAALRAAHPLPPPTGDLADKAFFDDLSGDY